MVTRQQLAQMLTEPQVRYAHPFACRNTYGFGADFLGLLKTLTAYLNLRLGFYLCPPKRPQEIGRAHV